MLDLGATLELRRAGDYCAPRKGTALLPVVYGDMSLGGSGGLWDAVCLDKDAFVYALAGHALRPEAAGNPVSLYDGDGNQIAASGYTLDLAHNFEGQGVIATATFGEDAHSREPITVRAQGRADEMGGLITNPVEIIRDLLVNLAGADAEDLDQACFGRARGRADSLGYAAAGVIEKQAAVGNLITAVLADFLGSWWLGGKGRLRVFLDLGAGSLSESDIAACLRQGDLSEVSVRAKLADLVNRAPVSYAHNFAAKEHQAYFDGLDTQDPRAQGLYGVSAAALELSWVRSASVARTVSQRLVDLLGRPRRVISCRDNSLVNLPLEKGDAVLVSLSWLMDPQGRPLKNQIVRVLGLEPDLDAGTVGYTLLDSGLYKTLAAPADGRSLADGSLEAGGDRDRNDYQERIMSDLRIQYDEEMVGAGHPTKEDTLNRLMLADHDSAGLHQRATLVVQEDDPDTETDQAALYVKNSGGLAELFFRGADGGEVIQLTSDGELNGVQAATLVGCLPAWSSANIFTLTSGEVDIRGSLYRISSTLTKDGQSGFATYTWLYIKLSAPSSGNELDADCVALDATPPQWSDAYKAWYIDTERVIGMIRSDASGGLEPFSCDGGIFQLSSGSIFPLSTSSPAASATALGVGLPALGRLWWYGQAYLSQANAQTYWVYMGSDGTDGSTAGAIAKQNAPGDYVTPFSMMTDASGNVYYHVYWSGSGSLQLHCRGFALPAGLAR